MATVVRRAVVSVALSALLALALVPAVSSAHPLGNFTINHLTTIRVSAGRVDLGYVLDQAEIPTFQERGRPRGAVLADKVLRAREGLILAVDGRRVPLRTEPGARIALPPGQGGLPTTRVEVSFSAPVDARGQVTLRDETFPGRIGWKAIVARPGEGTAVRSTAPSGDPTNGLRSYPKDLLSSPLDIRSASLEVGPGDGTLVAPRSPGGERATTGNRSGDGFAGVFGDAAAGRGALLFFLLAAFAWGGFHALSPGHGKAMVAAYLVGTRGTARHAVALGATVTITHTIGVFALGLVTLVLSQYVLPEQLYPWLNLASGLLVVVVGVGVLRSRVRWGRARRSHAHNHHGHDHAEHGHEGHDHAGHGHGHSHDIPERITWRGLIGMGASAGLIPCPSALVVLLAAIAQHQVALGLLLIVVFSLGLATTLSVLGLIVVNAGRIATRASRRLTFSSRVAAALPALSALVIVGAGIVLTARAVPQLA
jgi:nickel/cobalt transporter (NicO) family protein